MSEWEPATDAEAAMRDALRTDDQEQYFRILAGIDLLLPVSADALAGLAPLGWGTWSTGGRTHVLAFTSPSALQSCLADYTGSARRVRYRELADTWPNLEWWLAVNPGLPIEGYLPAWFVAQLARGDLRLPHRQPAAHGPAADQHGAAAPGALSGPPSGPADLSGPPLGARDPSGPPPGPADRAAPATPPVSPAGPGASAGATAARPAAAPFAAVADAAAPEAAVPHGTVLATASRGAAPPVSPAARGVTAPAGERPGPSAGDLAAAATRGPAPVHDDTAATGPALGPGGLPLRPPGGTLPSGLPSRIPRDPDRAADPGPADLSPADPGPADLSPADPGPADLSLAGAGAAAERDAGPAAVAAPFPADVTERPAEGSNGHVAGSGAAPEAPGARPADRDPVSADPYRTPGSPDTYRDPLPEYADRDAAPEDADRDPIADRDRDVRPENDTDRNGEPDPGGAVSSTGSDTFPGSDTFTGSVSPAGRPADDLPDRRAADGRDGADTVHDGADAVHGAGRDTGPPYGATAAPPDAPSPAGPLPVRTPTAQTSPAHPAGGPAADPPAAAALADPVSTAPYPGEASGGAAGRAAGDPGAAGIAGPVAASGDPSPVSGGGRRSASEGPGDRGSGSASDGPGERSFESASDDGGSSPQDGGAAAPSAVDGDGAAWPAPSSADDAGAGPDPLPRRATATPPSGVDPAGYHSTGDGGAGDGRAPSTTEQAASREPGGRRTGGIPVARAATVPEPPGPADWYGDDPTITRPAPEPAADAGDEPFIPANTVERDLYAAAGGHSTDRFLSTLLLATVLVPVHDGAPGADRPAYRTEDVDGEPYLVVFTSPQRLAEHHAAPVRTVAVRFVDLILSWPDPAWSFAVNPDGPIGARYPGPQVLALANWAAEAGLGGGRAEDAPEPTAAPPPLPRDADVERLPTIMQKTLPPAQVDYFLERGYDRVAGFVHRAAEVAHLRTPQELLPALGLLYDGSPYRGDADEMHVLRWPAYRPSLYRIPYGGQTEQALRAMDGWVIERPPFRGNGFAPGESSDVIAEFKVDSVRLPHGAQLWRMAADGTEQMVAVFDADGPTWRRVGER